MDTPIAVITMVHGTFACGSRWPLLESKLSEVTSNGARIKYFEWSGCNSVRARASASMELRRHLASLKDEYLGCPQFVIAHSHGGNVALQAVSDADIGCRLNGLICLSTPFLSARVRPGSNDMLARFLIGGLLWLTLIFELISPMSIFVASATEGILFVGMALVALALRRGAVLRFAELTRQPTDLEAPVLILRTDSDEAAFALATVQLVRWLVRRVWRTLRRSEFLVARVLGLGRRGFRFQRFTPRFPLWRLQLAGTAALGVVACGVLWLFARAYEHRLHYRLAHLLNLNVKVFEVAAIGIFLVIIAVAFVMVLLISVTAVFSLLLPPVVFLLSLPLAVFGLEFAVYGTVLDVSAEPTPFGRWVVQQVRTRKSGLQHSASYADERAIAEIGRWLLERLAK